MRMVYRSWQNCSVFLGAECWKDIMHGWDLVWELGTSFKIPWLPIHTLEAIYCHKSTIFWYRSVQCLPCSWNSKIWFWLCTIPWSPHHQQMYKFLFAFLGLFSSFPVAKKLTSDPKILNLGTEMLFNILCLISDYNPFQRYKFVDYFKGLRYLVQKLSPKCQQQQQVASRWVVKEIKRTLWEG
jgi:hypothetical protein